MTEVSAPGWYPDPEGSDGERWWDGEKWGASVLPRLSSPSSSLSKAALPDFTFKTPEKIEPVKEEPEAVITPEVLDEVNEESSEELSENNEEQSVETSSVELTEGQEVEPVAAFVDESEEESVEVAHSNPEIIHEEVPSELVEEELTPVTPESKKASKVKKTKPVKPPKAKKEKIIKPKKPKKPVNPKVKQAVTAIGLVILIVFLALAAAFFLLSDSGKDNSPVAPGPIISSAPTESYSITPSTPAATSQETLTGEAYPAYVKDNFMESCEPGADNQAAVCECIFTTIQNKITFDDFVKLDKISSSASDTWSKKDQKAVEQLKTITNDCVLKYYEPVAG